MMRLTRLTLLITLISSSWTAPAAALSVVELRNEAKSAFRAGDYDRAATLYHELIKQEPGRLKVHKEAMWAFWNMGRIADAQTMANTVKSLSPDDVEAQKILGWAPAALNRKRVSDLHSTARAAYQRGDYSEATDTFRQITSLDPSNVTMLRDQMWLLWNMKRVGEATDIAQKIIRLRPGDRDAQSVLDRAPNVEARIRRNDPATPEKVLDLQEKAAQDPSNATAHRQLAWALVNTKRGDEAEAVLKNFLNANPDNADMWHQLGKIQQARGLEEAANTSYLKSLELDPNQPALLTAIGRRQFSARNLDESVRYFERAVALGSVESRELLPILAKSLFYRGEYRRSAEAWAQAADAFPDKSEYRFHEAEAIFYAGDEGLALAKMRQLKYESRDEKAVAFLIDNAVAKKDYSAAAVFMAEDLDRLSIEKGRKVIRLANIYVKLNRLNNAIALLKRWTNFVPRDVWALLTQAGIQRDAARFHDAVETYEQVLRLNPRVIEAHTGLAQSYFSLGEDEKGLEYLAKALALEPTNPHMIRTYATALFTNGQRRKARQMLIDWTRDNAKSVPLPILLYHGLTPFDDSPMLGYEIHTTITAFESQMRSLREAGYEPVTMEQVADWHQGRDTVPEKPIFIAFDDARMDSFRYADPILDQYGLHATMFVPLDDVESFGSIGYANWTKIKEYKRTGRWHMQAHGGRAHSKISVDARGRKMLYLVMPKWLSGQERPESEEEWKQRIEEDHKLIKRKLINNVGTDPIGYAWPEGAYGEHSDSKTAIENNLSLVRKHFSYAFVQDQYGINLPSQDPIFLHRIEPPKEWTGKDLISHIANNNPVVLATRELLQMAISEKKFAEANQWLAKLKELGVSEHFYLAEKARINYASGRSSAAYQLALQSFTTEPTPEVQKMLTDFKSRTGIAWRPTVAFSHDNQKREGFVFEQEIEIPLALQVKGLVLHGRAKFREDDVEPVYQTKLGGGLQLGWGDGQTIKALLSQHTVTGSTKDLIGYQATYWARWTDNFRTRIEARRLFREGAKAITANVRESNYRAMFHYGEKDDWGVEAQGRFSDYSDENERVGGEFEAGLPIWKRRVMFGPVYRYSYEDTKRDSELYYAPQNLNIHQLGPQFTLAPKSGLNFKLRYMPGYSKEKNRNSRFVQGGEASLVWGITPNSTIAPSFFYEETGSYYYNLSYLEVEIRF